ncbi:ABC transporter substrate-binding protein [Carbonactinospora thermoautotrophica]|nr:transporter substrate-binding domain-containing protein [Carbonactinospora thermoautotrophica]MCX9193584.1 ABC transporter substrate-binding protein [Carbonactinospora thermoautotrophica]
MKLAASLAALTLALLTGGTAVVAGHRTPAHQTALEEVVERGEIRVCTTGDYRPFTYRDPKTGQYTGIDVDMAKDLAAALGVRVTFVPTTWRTLMSDFTAGRCDIGAGGVSVTLDRARQAYFSEPYLRDGKTPITRCENASRFQTLAQIDQPGVRVVVNPGGTNERFARENLKQATIVVHEDNTTIFDQIVAGRADLMITDSSEARYQAKIHPELCAVHPDQPFTFAEKAYLLPRGDEEFKHWVDQWVHLRTHDGTYRRLSDAWMR